MSILSCLSFLGFLGCGDNKSQSDTTGNSSVTISQLKQIVDSGKDVFLLDVRTEPEFTQARLDFTDLRISYDSLAAFRSLLPKDTTTDIYVFCRSGRRSGIATTYLKSIGYINARNVEGGILAWQKAGYKTVSGKKE